MGKKLTFEEVNRRLEKNNRTVRLVGDYIDNKHKIKFLCLICNNIWETRTDSVLNGSNCNICGGNLPLSFDIVNERLQNDNRQLQLIGTFTNVDDKSTFKCLLCEHIWDTKVDNILRGSGCPNCNIYGFKYDKPAFLYYVSFIYEQQSYYKIGITNNSLKIRFGKEYKLFNTILKVFYNFGIDAYNEEQHLLQKYSDYRYNGKPILNSGGNTEIFIKDIFR